jgi:hypothetical protein
VGSSREETTGSAAEEPARKESIRRNDSDEMRENVYVSGTRETRRRKTLPGVALL